MEYCFIPRKCNNNHSGAIISFCTECDKCLLDVEQISFWGDTKPVRFFCARAQFKNLCHVKLWQQVCQLAITMVGVIAELVTAAVTLTLVDPSLPFSVPMP